MIELKIPGIYWDDEKAVSLLVEYFTRRRSSGDLFYSGAHFERLGGGGDADHVADRFDSYDLVAITTLSVSLEPHGAINLLQPRRIVCGDPQDVVDAAAQEVRCFG